MKNRPHVAEYLLETLQSGENVSKAAYEETDADVLCGVTFAANHQEFAFWVGDHTVHIGGQPTQSELSAIAEELPA